MFLKYCDGPLCHWKYNLTSVVSVIYCHGSHFFVACFDKNIIFWKYKYLCMPIAYCPKLLFLRHHTNYVVFAVCSRKLGWNTDRKYIKYGFCGEHSKLLQIKLPIAFIWLWPLNSQTGLRGHTKAGLLMHKVLTPIQNQKRHWVKLACSCTMIFKSVIQCRPILKNY